MINSVSSIPGSRSYYDFGLRRKSAAGEEDAFAQGRPEAVQGKKEDGSQQDAVAGKKDTTAAGKELSDQQQKELESLKKRDQEVRQHEAAHQAAAGGLARGKSFSYQRGHDGKQYAVGGEVQIDTSAGRTPQETIARMQTIQRAAMAPADPSGQDQKVASQAARTLAEAQKELGAQSSGGESDTAPAGEKVKDRNPGSGEAASSRKSFSDTLAGMQKKKSPEKSSSEQISATLQNSRRLRTVYTQNSGIAPLKCSMCQGSGCYHAG